MTTISGAGAHGAVADTDRLPASKSGNKGYHTIQSIKDHVLDGVATGETDTDPLLAANSDAKIASQKAVKKYIDDLRTPSLVDQITSAVTRAAIKDLSQTASLSTEIQAACDAADNTGNAIDFCNGVFPIDDSIVTSGVTWRGVPYLDGSTPYGGGGSVLRVTSTTKNPIKPNGGGFSLIDFAVRYPNQVDVAATDLITYPAFIKNNSTTTTIGGLRFERVDIFGAWKIAEFGGAETYNKAGLLQFQQVRAAALDTYFTMSHCPDMTQFSDCLFGINIQGDDFLHFSTGGAGGIVNISSITRSGSTVTVTTAAAHGLTTASSPSVRGLNESGYNVENIKIASVPSSTTFTYEITTTPASPGTGTGKVHNFKMRDKARDAVFLEVWGDGATDTLATLSVDGVMMSNCGLYGGGTVYKIRGDGGSDQGGFLQIVTHSGGIIDAWRKLLEIDPGGCVYTFNVTGVSGFQERIGDPYTFDYWLDIDSPAPGRDASNNPIAICDVSVTEFELGFMRGGLLTTTGSYVRRITLRGACPDMLHCRTAGDRYAVVIDSPNTVVEIDMKFAGASHLTTGLRKFIHITSNATNAKVRIRGAYKGWDQIITNNSVSADVTFDGIGYGLLGEAIGGTYAANVRCSSQSVFDLHQRAFNPLRLEGVYQAVNGVNVGGAATGYRPYLKAVGDDTNVGLDFLTQGTNDFGSSIAFKPGGFAGMTVRAVNNAVNFFYVLPAATTGAVFFGALGTDTDINMVISPKGAGKFYCSSDALPLNNNTQALGDGTFRWADLFLGSGAVVNFAGGVTITDSSGKITVAGGALELSTPLAMASGGTGANKGAARLLFELIAADMNTTADQVFTKIGTFTQYQIDHIRITRASTSLTTAVGGIYSAASKGGDALLAASQVYNGATGPTLGFNLAATSLGFATRTETPILSLTTPQGAAATLNYRIYGWILDAADTP